MIAANFQKLLNKLRDLSAGLAKGSIRALQ
jgi:hypothetical protein